MPLFPTYPKRKVIRKGGKDMKSIKGITSTIVFESSAINGDVNIGIHSIKKLSRDNGVFSVLSRPSMGNKAFNTLSYTADWQCAPLTYDDDVIQFRFPEANIIQYPEMDVFGFMNTSVFGNKKISVTRKAPMGMTKAISLEPYQGDTAFYANHGLVARANSQFFSDDNDEKKRANPNPYTKEEHYSFYRFSFTIDLCRLGFHEVPIMTSEVTSKKEAEKVLGDINKWIDSFEAIEFEKTEFNPLYNLSLPGEEMQWYKVPKHMVLKNKEEKILGYLGVFKTNKEQDFLLTFVLTKEERDKRLKDLLTIMVDGLQSHSRTENYGVDPIFIAIATLTNPMPLFHSRMKWNGQGLDEKPLNNLVGNNSYIKKAWYIDDLGLCPGIKVKSENQTKYYNELHGIEEILNEINGADTNGQNKCD